MLRLLSKLLVCLSVAALVLGCTKKEEAKTTKAIPVDVDVVAHMDGKPLVAFARELMTGMSSDQKDRALNFDTLNKKIKEMVGIDLDQIGKVTLVGYSGPKNKIAFIAEGIDPASLKGEKRTEHNGIALYHMEKDIDYAYLAGLGMVVGPSEEMLKKILDTYTGKTKNITKGDRSEMLAKFSGFHTGLNQVRMYVLNPQLPQQAAKNFSLNGAGFFMHMDKGLTLTLVSDEKGAGNLKTQIDQGLSAARMMLSSDGALGIPIKLDDATKRVITNVIENIKVVQSGSTVSIHFHQSLKPLVQKVLAVGLQKMAPESTPDQPATKEETPSKKEG